MRVQLLLLFVASVTSYVLAHDGRHDPRLQRLLADLEDRDLTLESRAEARNPHHARSAHHRDSHYDDDDVDRDLTLEARTEAQNPHHARSAHYRDDDDVTAESYLRRPLYKHYDYDDDDDDDDRDATVESRAGSGEHGEKNPHHRDFFDVDRDATVESRADAKNPHHTRRQHHKLSRFHKKQYYSGRHKLHGLHLHHLDKKRPRLSDGNSRSFSFEDGRQNYERDVTVESRADDVKPVHHQRLYG